MQRVDRDVALREIARAFLGSAGQTIPGELARVAGLSRPEADAAIARSSPKDTPRCPRPVLRVGVGSAVNSPLAASLGR